MSRRGPPAASETRPDARTVLEQPVVDPLSGGRAVAQQQRGAGREHFEVSEWTDGASEKCSRIIA